MNFDYLEYSCRPNSWPSWSCALGDVFGAISLFALHVTLLPQLYYNFRRQSTEGLSFLWIIITLLACMLIELFTIIIIITNILILLSSNIYLFNFIFLIFN